MRKRPKRKQGEQVSESSSESSQSQTLSAASDTQSDSSQPQGCKLARFDLQERLENCVKQEHESIKQEASETEEVATPLGSPEVKISEEYSPLKFCQITMEENDSKSDLNSSPKRTPSRKQPVPKKIERNVTPLRKLAPKPEGAAVSSEPAQVGRKKYACHLCTKVFGWSTDLKRHILVHTGERPFKCENCQATFTRNFLLQKHQSKVHPCKPKPPELKAEADGKEEGTKVKLEATDLNEEDEDDDDEGRLVITEEVDEKPDCNLIQSSNCSSDKWRRTSNKSESRCADLKRSDMFKTTPIKVLTM